MSAGRARAAGLVAGLVAGLAALAALGCRGEPSEPAPTATSTSTSTTSSRPTAPAPTSSSGLLEGALLTARYEPRALAAVVARLPRPTPTGSPLVEVFAAIVDELRGDPLDRLAALGIRDDAAIELSLRPLTGRAAAVRKRLGELAEDAVPEPRSLAELRSEAGTLGVHLRASLPVADEARLHAGLRAVAGDDSGEDARAGCPALLATGASLCVGRERILAWAQPAADGRVRVDAIYRFSGAAEAEQLAWILARADAWPARAGTVAEAPPGSAMVVEVLAEPTAELLAAEALSDAVVALAEQRLDYHGFLDAEHALTELLAPPSARVFEGLRIRVALEGEAMRAELAWIPAEQPAVALAELFAPILEPTTVPSVASLCADVAACVRVTGLSVTPRFAALALGAFADTTGVGRILRQAGDAGPILIGLSSWPSLLGTAGRMAAPSSAGAGLMSEAQAALVEHSYAIGGALVELGDDADDDQLAAFVRVGPAAYAAIRPLAGLAGIGPRPISLAGVEGLVDRGRYQDTPVYFVDERAPGQPDDPRGGWLLIADADARARWLLTRPREPGEASRLMHVQVFELGRLSAREGLPFADDPAVRAWLDARTLDVELRLSPDGPIVTATLVEPPRRG